LTKLGFTGTQHGMTDIQAQIVFDEMMMYGRMEDAITEAHHGCCVGADAQFDAMLAYMDKSVVVHGHPPLNTTKMAQCDVDVMHEPLDYLVRNRAIVDAVDTLFAAPKGEEELRSGTWSTVRYARRKGINIRIIMPNGASRFERAKGDLFR
jgi:hypothetical protein